jgi:L-cysteine:1D-myo-inositol 2-amino-2-deoxy-alpha-D-glucopyranoside ligase
MRLFNTLTQRLEPLIVSSDAADPVTLYVCGITPYDTTHLGHAFINVIYDSLVRYLRWRGAAVRYVQNVTDIDDDILRKAREVGTTWDALGRRETERYLADLRSLNVALPDVYAHASEETPQMIALIEALIARDVAYVRDGWVYYAVRRDPDFGRLAEAAGYVGYANWLAIANERGNYPDDPRKDDPLDFVLWQAQQPGEPAWPSPWGPGRPGWHIECSAMATKYLGPSLTIHGGGTDLIFPHHTCEIAQSEHATGVRPFVRTWMHCAMVHEQGEKMSKSLGNLVLVRDLLRTYTPDAVRAMLLGHHYRVEWEYTEDDMRAAVATAARLAEALAGTPDVEGTAPGDDPTSRQARLEFVAALEDDFDTGRALQALERLADSVRRTADAGQAALLRALGGTFGLRLDAAAKQESETATATGAVQGA